MKSQTDAVLGSEPAPVGPPAAAPAASAPAGPHLPAVMPQASSPIRRWAWIPLLVLPLALVVLKMAEGSVAYDSPGLRGLLTLVFGALVMLAVFSLVARSFLVRGQPGLLVLACGILFLGSSGILAVVAGGRSVNLSITIFNLCAWLAAVCHFVGIFLLLRPRRALPAPGLWLWLALLLVGVALGLVVLVVFQDWMPLFFIRGYGGTPERQVVLSSTTTLFALAALLPCAVRRQPLSPFFYWYSLAQGLAATGFLGALLQSVFGSLLSWTAWGTMCLSAVYMVVAAVAAMREARAWGTTLEGALQESEERFQALAEASFEGIVFLENGRITDCNDQYLQLVGYRREELLGQNVGALIAAEDRARVMAGILDGREICSETGLVRKDGSRLVVEARGKLFTYQGRMVRVAAIRDITARKQAEAALALAQAQLQQHATELEQMVASRTVKLHEAISELEHFSYAITHDMRAPLRAMQGYAEILDKRCAECRHTMSRDFFRRIKAAASRMDQLITDSLNYSKAVRQKLALEPIHLQELLQGMIESYPHLLPDQADIRLTPLPTVLGNQAALVQCFGNLLDNAVKFAKPNTKPQIHIWAELVDSGGLIVDRRPVTPQASTPSGYPPSTLNHQLVRIWVEDNGVGIPDQMRERIFGLFERGSNEQEGTGLGLAIVRKLARRMGGEVGVESEPGQGSRFWVELQGAPIGQSLKR